MDRRCNELSLGDCNKCAKDCAPHARMLFHVDQLHGYLKEKDDYMRGALVVFLEALVKKGDVDKALKEVDDRIDTDKVDNPEQFQNDFMVLIERLKINKLSGMAAVCRGDVIRQALDVTDTQPKFSVIGPDTIMVCLV